jgi:hypothetical protein
MGGVSVNHTKDAFSDKIYWWLHAAVLRKSFARLRVTARDCPPRRSVRRGFFRCGGIGGNHGF